ncbi:type II toxin-antitoxin system VapC family toxin [Nocardioides limicola]|uniref:type II toxin-antitoxin system VapC family toxin n=1 Tax=Nocardioides limicola TaxID=2803368 RepID=UPI00193BE866|nr:type II toxin-antitoxin system VapC family toxin [Nocardioides sp. DJM-14]
MSGAANRGDLLLDTHAFYWCVARGATVPAHVLTALESSPRRFVSAGSAFEVSLKVRLGKYTGAAALCGSWSEARGGLRALELAVTTDDALLAGTLDWDHKDPFDRLLAAQALNHELTLVTADPAFDGVADLAVLRW